MTKQSQKGPRDVERGNPDDALLINTNNAPDPEPQAEKDSVKGAVVREVPEAAEQQFPGKGEGSNRRTGGKDAA